MSERGRNSGKFGIVISIALAACVAFGLCVRLVALIAWLDARGWIQVPATILSVERQKRGFLCEYSYVWQGQRHTGSANSIYDTVAGMPLAADINAVVELESKLAQREDGLCYVDPDSPDRAVLNRDYRAGEQAGIAAAVMMAVFFLVIGTRNWAIARPAEPETRRARFRACYEKLKDPGKARRFAVTLFGVFAVLVLPDIVAVAVLRTIPGGFVVWWFCGSLICLVLPQVLTHEFE